MKKLLIFIMAVLMLMVPCVSAYLDEFEITTPSTIWGGESFEVKIEALDENGTTIGDFNDTVNIDWEADSDSVDLTHGEGKYNVTSAPNGDFTITVSYDDVSNSTDVTGLYYEMTVSPSSVSETAVENVTVSVSQTITISNTGTESLTGIEAEYTGDLVSRASITSLVSSLTSGSSDDALFVYNTEDLSAGTYTGNIVIEATELDDDITIPVTITVEEEEEERILYIDEVEINGEKLSLSDYEDGDDLTINANEIVGEDIEVVITIKNDGDEDMEDVDVDLTIEGIDDGDDIDDDDTIDRINDDDEEEITFTFAASSINWDADEDTYTVTIDIEGTGRESDDDYDDNWDFDMSVEREDNDVEITSAELEESTIEPGDTTYLNIEIANLGTDDQDEVVLSVESDQLGIDYFDKNIQLDEGDDYTVTIPVKALSSLKEGSYSIDIAVYYDWDEYNDEDPTDATKVNLVVEKFAEEQEEEQESEEESGEGIIVPEQTIPSYIPTTEEISFRETTAYTVLLVLGSVLLVSMIVFLLVQIFRH